MSTLFLGTIRMKSETKSDLKYVYPFFVHQRDDYVMPMVIW